MMSPNFFLCTLIAAVGFALAGCSNTDNLARSEAARARYEAEQARLEAEKARLEAEKARQQAARTRAAAARPRPSPANEIFEPVRKTPSTINDPLYGRD